VDRLSAAGRRALDEAGHRVGDVEMAFTEWQRMVTTEDPRLWTDDPGCGQAGCCSDPAELRATVERGLSVLPARDRRAFAAAVAALDARARVLRSAALQRLAEDA